jgi:hypothetical protein
MSPRQVAAEIRRLRKISVPYSVTFVDGIPKELAVDVEKQLKEKFHIWYDTWVLPLASHLDPKAKKTFGR